MIKLMSGRRLVAAFFLAPFAACVVVGALLIVAGAETDFSGLQDDGKYVPTLWLLLGLLYLFNLILEIPLYFLVSRMKWTSPWEVPLVGGIAQALFLGALMFALTREFGAKGLIVLAAFALIGAVWGVAFWWLAFRTRAELVPTFPRPPLQRE